MAEKIQVIEIAPKQSSRIAHLWNQEHRAPRAYTKNKLVKNVLQKRFESESSSYRKEHSDRLYRIPSGPIRLAGC